MTTQGESKPFTGRVLVDAYSDAIRDLPRGVAGSADAVRYFGDKLNEIATRPDQYGLAARRLRADFTSFFDAANRGEAKDPSSFLSSEAVQGLGGYLVDGGDYESRRRYDLLGVNRQPSYTGPDGGIYVDAAGASQRIPVEKYLDKKAELIDAFQGKGPLLGKFSGGLSTIWKGVDLTDRALQMATQGKDWSETVPLVDVPTADPSMPFALMPQGLSASDEETYRLLQNPVEVRAMQEALAKFSADGDLDLGAWDHFLGAAGFLADFAAVGEVTGGIGKAAGAALGGAAKLTGIGGKLPTLVGETAKAAEGATALESPGALVRPAIPHSFATIRDFAAYRLINDTLYGRVESVNDATVSGLAGAKEGALMLGAGFLTRIARTGVMRGLASKSLDSATQTLQYRFGPLGRAVGGLYEAARDKEGVDSLVGRIAGLAGEGRGLREQLVRAGWIPARAQMVEHMIDSASMGLMFGAYNDAISDPNYEKMGPGEKTARVVAGLTSPEAIGGAAAFSGSVLAGAYAHKVKWGKEWENAPPELRREFDQRVQNVVMGLAQPESHEPIEAFRKAFDAYRARSPKDFEGWSFRTPWEQEAAMAVADGTASQMRPQPPPEEPPPQGQGAEPPPTAPGGAPGVAEMPTEPGMFGPQERQQVQREVGGERAVQPNLLDVQTGDMRGQTSMLDRPASEDAPYDFTADNAKLRAMQSAAAPQPEPETAQELAARIQGKSKKGSKPQTFAERIANTVARAHAGELGFRAYVQAIGGLSLTKERAAGTLRGAGLTSELERYSLKEFGETKRLGLGRLVHTEKSAKGMSVAEAVERAIEDGMISREGGEREFFDRLSDDTTLRQAERGGETAESEHFKMLDQQARDQGYASYAEAMEVARLAAREGAQAQPAAEGEGDFTLFQAGRQQGIVAYHATRETDVMRGGFYPWSHFGTKRAAHERLRFHQAGDPTAEGSRVVPVILDIRNPYRASDAEVNAPLLLLEKMQRDGLLSHDERVAIMRSNGRTAAGGFEAIETSVQRVLERNGYDGLVYTNKAEHSGSQSYVNFSNKQVRSLLTSDVVTLFQRGQNPPGFIDFPDRPTRAMSPESSKAWLATVQNTLFPITEFRNERMSGMVRALVGTFGLKAEEAEAIAALAESHAEVWAKSQGKPIEAWYHERLAGMTRNQPPLGAPEGARAATTFLSDGRAVLHALERPTLDSVVEEFAHIWRHDLQGKAKDTLEAWAGVRDGSWTVKADERFAAGLRRWVRSGKAPTSALQAVFNKLGEWMRVIFPRLAGTGLDVRMSSDVRKAIGSLWKLPSLDDDVVTRERAARLTPEVRGTIYRTNRNKPQYVGMQLDEIVAHELRGGLPEVERTTAIKVAQAGDSMREAAEVLVLHGALGREIPVDHQLYQRAILDLVEGGQKFAGRFQALNAMDALGLAVDAAKRAQAQMREASLDVQPDEKRRANLGLVFEYLDAAKGTEVPEELTAKLVKAGLANEKTGRANRMTIAQLGDSIASGVALARYAGAVEVGERLDEPICGARPWLAMGRVDNAFVEHTAARTVKLKRLVDAYEKAKLPPSLLKQLQRVGLVFGGMWQANGLDSVASATVKAAAMHVFHPWETAVQTLQGRGDEVLARILSRFGWRLPPSSHMKLLNWAIESGELQRMKGPEDFEKFRKGTGYLFDLTRDLNDTLMQMGQLGVLSHMLAPGQYEKFGGKWKPHLALKLEADQSVKELREGRVPLSWGSRSLSRRETPEEKGVLQIEDPLNWVPTALHQEGRITQYLGTIADLLHGGYAISAADFDKLDPYTKIQYERFGLDGEKHPAGLGNGPALRNFSVLGDLLARQYDENDPRPKSKQLQRTIERLLNIDPATRKQRPEGAMYLPKTLLWELDGLTAHTWNPPELEHWHQRAFTAYEQATRAFRRGLTIGRPKHWTLNIFNSVGTNHALDRLPMWDVARGVFTGHGYFADAVRDCAAVLEHAQMGNPKEKPADWSVDKWDRVQMFHEAFKHLHGTTFTGVGLEGSVVTDAFSAVVTPDLQTAGLLRDMQAQGFSPEHASQWKLAIMEASRRVTGGMAEFDRRLNKAMGSHDPAERARAVQSFTSMYQLWEMLFKWSATLRTIDTQPEGISLDNAVRFAAVGTADYSNTSPLMRSFNTAYGTFTNPLFRKTEGPMGQTARMLTREALKGRFWMYSSTMAPALLGSVATHPMRAATIMAVGTGLTAMLHSLTTSSREEDAAWQEDLRGSIGNAEGPALDEATLKALDKAGVGYPNVNGGPMVVDRKLAGEVWRRLLGGSALVFQAPNRGDETRISSLVDLAPGYGNWIGLVNGAKGFAASNNDQRVSAIFDMLSLRSMELSLALANGGVQGAKVLTSDGPDAYLDAMKGLRQAASDVLPTISPMFLASRDGQRFLEVAALNGQNFDEYARGVVQVEHPSAEANVGEFMFSALWRSQRLLQPQLGGVTEREALDGMLGRMFPGADRPSSGIYWDKLRAAQGQVHYQLAEALSGTYEEWLKWGRSTMSYDAMLVPALLGPQGPMEQFFSQERDPEKQAMMRDYFQRFVTGDEWGRAVGQMAQVARTRSMRPEYFRSAMSASLRDPTGQALLNWIERQMAEERPKGERLENLASAFLLGVQAPNPGSARYDQWSKLLGRFYEYGLSSTFIPDNAADALRRLGKKPELAGGPALDQALLTR